MTIGSGVTKIGCLAFSDTGIYNNGENWTGEVLYIDGCLIDVKETIAGNYEILPGTR